MKTIVIMMAIVASATAQTMRASLTLNSASIPIAGNIIFIQNNRKARVQMIGKITNLETGRYYGFVHQKHNFSDHCVGLGPVDIISDDRFFHVFTINVSPCNQQTFRMAAGSLTLHPGEQYTLVNRSIALHDGILIDLGVIGLNNPPIACGVVHLE